MSSSITKAADTAISLIELGGLGVLGYLAYEIWTQWGGSIEDIVAWLKKFFGEQRQGTTNDTPYTLAWWEDLLTGNVGDSSKNPIFNNHPLDNLIDPKITYDLWHATYAGNGDQWIVNMSGTDLKTEEDYFYAHNPLADRKTDIHYGLDYNSYESEHRTENYYGLKREVAYDTPQPLDLQWPIHSLTPPLIPTYWPNGGGQTNTDPQGNPQWSDPNNPLNPGGHPDEGVSQFTRTRL